MGYKGSPPLSSSVSISPNLLITKANVMILPLSTMLLRKFKLKSERDILEKVGPLHLHHRTKETRKKTLAANLLEAVIRM